MRILRPSVMLALMILGCSNGGTGPNNSATLNVGIGKRDITPVGGSSLYRVDMSTNKWTYLTTQGIQSRPFVKAVYFQGEKTNIRTPSPKAVLITMDLVGVFRQDAQLHQRVAQRLDMPPEAVVICATHTHSTPHVERDSAFDELVIRSVVEACP